MEEEDTIACRGSILCMDASESLPGLPEPPGSPGELVVQNGRLSGARRPLAGLLTLIGQASGCDIRLNVDGVSPLHCAIVDDPNGPILRDLGTSAGTRVNGAPVVAHRLVNGDLVEVGPFQFAVALGPPPTSEMRSAGAVNLNQEREALRVQAAAVAAQQAALVEEEGRLEQRATALERQEEQLASHLEDRQRGLDQAEERLREARADFEEECSGRREELDQLQRALEQARSEVEQERKKAGKERQRLGELRRRLRKRWRRHFDAKAAELQKQEKEAAGALESARGERARVRAFQERTNGELELGRRQLREEWQQLGLAQQHWEEAINLQAGEQQRQQQELEARVADLAAREEALAAERRRWEKVHAGLVKEAQGLEARIGNQRTRLEALAREAAQHEAKLAGAPPVEPLSASPGRVPPAAQEPFPVTLKELAGTLSDQRLHLTEQWQRLLQVQEGWQEERAAALAELEATAAGLAEREVELKTAAQIIEAARLHLELRQAELSRLKSTLEGWQARLLVQESGGQAEREALLGQVESRERMLEVRSRQLEDVHQRRNRRRRREVEELHQARARCDEARRQYGALWQECEHLRETLGRQERALSGRVLALERYRQETISQSPDSSRAESQLEKLRRREGARLQAEARDLAAERQKLQEERARLDLQATRLRELEEELLLEQREHADEVARWESRIAAAGVEEEQRLEEVRRQRALQALHERQVRQLRDEVERLARVMLEEAEAPPSVPQAA
jgi:pSer/pThr/pTyr-binding forkhead associated (FHA) protein